MVEAIKRTVAGKSCIDFISGLCRHSVSGGHVVLYQLAHATEALMPNKLDKQYIENHMGVHNYESFGRSIVATVMEEALEKKRNEKSQDGGGGMSFNAEITLEATSSGCTWLTMYVNGRPVRIHQPPITSYPM
jgi:hypothetical protein